MTADNDLLTQTVTNGHVSLTDDVEEATTTFGPLRRCDTTDAAAAHLEGDKLLGGGTPYPDDNPKTAVGAKKPPVRSVPPVALLHLGGAMEDGARKYGRFNWRDHRVTSSVYYDAMLRHLLAWWDGEDSAADSRQHHLAHVMACCCILLDAADIGKLNDDRRSDGGAARRIAALTEV